MRIGGGGDYNHKEGTLNPFDAMPIAQVFTFDSDVKRVSSGPGKDERRVAS